MDDWQAWLTLLVGFVASKIGWENRQEKLRTEKFRDETNKQFSILTERITRVEAEIVTEREVREVMQELITPFTERLTKIEHTQENIASDVTEIKVALASMPKRKEEL